ncbi:ABC transporter permease [Vibrio sp. WXL210]|uniref:ABC transporter permease n=1 Tax=Vibrio sp. WXL210 TaxID=3450709 RepID=UPI003EC706E4
MKDFAKLIWRNPMALTGVIILAAFIFIALFAPYLTQHVPDKRTGKPHEYPGFVVKAAQNNPDGWVAENLATDRRTLAMSKDAEHVLGTTRMGRDVWSQVAHGARVSLAVGFGAGITVCILATIIGVSAGYFGGRVDDVLTAAMNIMLVIPQYPLLFVVAAFIGEAGPLTITLVIGFMSWAWGARVIRSQTLALREKEFVKAAEVLGESSWRIIFVEILPNLISIVGASFIGSVMYAVMMEATLSFLGLGDPNTISWGIMLYNVQTSSSMLIGAWWELLAPCIALTLLVTGLALLNFAVDEIANPQLRSHKGMKRWKKLAKRDKAERAPEPTPPTAILSGEK